MEENRLKRNKGRNEERLRKIDNNGKKCKIEKGKIRNFPIC